jgi:hypothetical protein
MAGETGFEFIRLLKCFVLIPLLLISTFLSYLNAEAGVCNVFANHL